MGASKPEQIVENVKAVELMDKFTPEIYSRINAILQNDPTPEVRSA